MLHGEALDHLDEAVRLARAHGLVELEIWARSSRAMTRLEVGRASAARHDVNGALRALAGAKVGEVSDVEHLDALLLSQITVLDHHAGHLQRAEEGHRAVARHPGASDDLAARAMNNVAFLLSQRGAFAEALRWADLAVVRSARAGEALHGQVLQTRAWVEARAGQLTRSLRDFEEAALVCERAGLPRGEQYTDYADAMRELRLFAEAEQASLHALDEFVSAGAGLMEVETRVRLAETRLLAGDLRGAEEAALTAIEVARRQKRTEWRLRASIVALGARFKRGEVTPAGVREARAAARALEVRGSLESAAEAYLQVGRSALAIGQRRTAEADLGSAARLSAGGPLLSRVRGRVAAALIGTLRDEPRLVLAECRAGLRDLARHRAALPTMELRALASGHGADLGDIGLGALLRQGSPAAVLRWMERTRAAAMLGRLPVEPMAPERNARPSYSHDLVGSARETRPAVINDDDGVDRLRRSSWTREVVRPGTGSHEVPGLGRIRDALAGRVLVELGQHDGRYVAVVVTSRDVRVAEVCDVAEIDEHLRALVFALRRLADPRSAAAAEAARVSAMRRLDLMRAALLDPLRLAPDDELVITPVGRLHGVPWSGLHRGPVSLAPSATAWVRTAEEPIGHGAPVLVAGPGLVGAGEEVEALQRVHPDALLLGAAESSAERVVDAVAGADLAHLACHGVLRSDNPMFSAVVLADGPLTVQELHRAGVAPRRLVLASCHSGADVSYAGNELLGLVAAMLSRGTAGVVASIAAVPDVEVVDLMLGLHRRLAAGETMARALHGARGEIDRSTPAGFVNWCTFSAHGAG
ncbi:CHAT domain-containing protein [Cellulomonas oligotrophica]|nr:CHAT domain-containing protein [Cellulomonas oligotrophica]